MRARRTACGTIHAWRFQRLGHMVICVSHAPGVSPTRDMAFVLFLPFHCLSYGASQAMLGRILLCLFRA